MGDKSSCTWGSVLAAVMCAVVVILAARAWRERPSPKPGAATTTRKVAAKTEKRGAPLLAAATTKAAPRDPFGSLTGPPAHAPRAADSHASDPSHPKTDKAEDPEEPRLTGIVDARPPMAVIELGEDTHDVHVGEKVGEYTLVKIETRSVVVTGRGKTLTLTMHKDKSQSTRSAPSGRPRR